MNFGIVDIRTRQTMEERHKERARKGFQGTEWYQQKPQEDALKSQSSFDQPCEPSTILRVRSCMR